MGNGCCTGAIMQYDTLTIRLCLSHALKNHFNRRVMYPFKYIRIGITTSQLSGFVLIFDKSPKGYKKQKTSPIE